MEANSLSSPPPVEREIALDIVRRGALVAPFVVLAGAVRGWAGVASAAVAVGIVLVNFLFAAAVMTRAARRANPVVLGGAAVAGYVVRLAIVLGALVVLRHQPWIDLPTLGIVLVATHLGLLAWEMQFLSLSLAAPGLSPASARASRSVRSHATSLGDR